MHDPLGVRICVLFVGLGTVIRPATAQESASALDRARSLRHAGEPAQAEVLLREAATAHPSDPDIFLEWSRTLADLDREEEALRTAEKAVSLRPEDTESRLWLAQMYLRQSQPDSALEHLLLVLRERPQDLALRRQVAQVLVWLDRNEEAIPHLEAYVAAVPGDLESLKTLYQLYLWTYRSDEALSTLERVTTLDPSDREAALEYARRCVDLDRLPQAIATYERLRQRDPTDAEAVCALGTLYEWTDAPRKALDAYEACLALRPFDSGARERALALSLDLGHGRKARTHARVLGLSDAAYEESARRALLEQTGHGTALGVDFQWFNDRLGFDHVAVGPWGALGLGEEVTLGARYVFHWMRGHPDLNGNIPEVTRIGHEAGLFGEVRWHDRWTLDLSASVTHYNSPWTSFNARVEQRADLDRVSLSLFGERADNRTTVGAVLDGVIFNTGGASVYWNPWRELFFFLLVEGTYVNPDKNVRFYGWGSAGYVFLDMPRLEVSYTYSIEHFRDHMEGGAVRSYFNPKAYQTHGPFVSFQHPVTSWFLYGLDLRLWHAVRDDALLATYGVTIGLRPGDRHSLDLAFRRTDTLVGTADALYQENILSASYVFEF